MKQAPSLTERTLGSAVWMFSGTGIQAGLRLLVLTILARLLGPADFGLAAAASVVIGFFQIFLRTGIRPVIVQRPVLEERHLRTAFTLSIALGTVFAGLVIAFAAPIARWSFGMPELAPVLEVVAFLLPVQSVGVVASSLLERELRFSWIVRRELFAYVFGYGLVGIALAFAGYGVWALVAAYLSQELLVAAFSLWAQPHPKRPQLDPAAARELTYYGTGFAAGRIGNFGAANGDNWVAGRFLGGEALGYYKYAFELTGMVGMLFGTVLDKVLFPALAKVQGDRALLGTAYRRGVGLSTAIVLPVSAAFFVLAPELVRVVLGPGWEAVVPPFRVLALALVIRTTSTMSDSLARATGAGYQRAWRQGVYAALVIGLAYAAHSFGLAALAAGVTIAILANSLLMIHLSMQVADLTWRQVLAAHFSAGPSFFLSAGMMAGSAAAARALALPPLAVVLLASAATGAALLAALRFRPGLLLGSDGTSAANTLIRAAVERFPRLLHVPLAAGVIGALARASSADSARP
jgi:O-antigen/teichoic acid export membrane protein